MTAQISTPTPPAGRGPAMTGLRRSLLAGLRGHVLEIGPGDGANLAHLDAAATWTGLEPDPVHGAAARRRAEALGRPGDVLDARAEEIPLAAGSVDAVVGTFVLCSVADPDRAAAEVRRVLAPGGAYVLIEHVAAPRGTWTRCTQDLETWLTARTSGCRSNRDAEAVLRRAGFVTDLLRFTEPGPLGTRIPFVAGTAWWGHQSGKYASNVPGRGWRHGSTE